MILLLRIAFSFVRGNKFLANISWCTSWPLISSFLLHFRFPASETNPVPGWMALACSTSLFAPFAASLSAFPFDVHAAARIQAGGYLAQGWVSDTALCRDSLMSVSSWISPHSPPASPPWPVMSARCLFQQALLSLLLASWAFPEHLCGQMVHPQLGSILKESESPFGHTFLIPLWACRSWHHPALNLFSRSTKTLRPDYFSPLSSLATPQTELLLSDYFQIFTLHGFKKVPWTSK